MKRAIALQYDGDFHEAPVVVSQGEGDLARRIERTAMELGIAVVHDVPLAESLAVLRIGEAIPEALYESVAAILSDIARSATGEGGDEVERPIAKEPNRRHTTLEKGGSRA